jgi:hypothetical protein
MVNDVEKANISARITQCLRNLLAIAQMLRK